MKIFTKIISVAMLAVALTACSSEITESTHRPAESVEVCFAVPTDATRTTIGPDGKTTRWSENDKLAVWAKNSGGDFVFENVTFSLRHFSESYDKAFFAANVAEMADGEYTYMLSYPRPSSVAGTLATYNVAATQSGKYDGLHDIMIADLVNEGPLTTGKMVTLNTVMRHQMHALKITVPEGRNIFGSRFYRLQITFPQAVVGNVTLDVSDPNEAPVYTNTSNTIIVENEEGFDEGDDIWVFVLPGMVDGDVSYKVESHIQESVSNTYALNRTMERGHVTPIKMATPEIYKYTSFVLSEGSSYLGEDFNSFQVYDKNNTHLATFVRNSENKYVFGFEGEIDFSAWENTDLRLVFDSDNAIVENTVRLGAIVPYIKNDVTPFVVPYLFAEDFSATTTSESYGNNDYASDDRKQPGVSLDGCMSTPGWNAARYWTKGNSMRINVRSQSVTSLFSSSHYGRLDTPTIPGLKSNANVRVKVMFDAGGHIHKNSDNATIVDVVLTTHTNTYNPIDGIPTGTKGISWSGITEYSTTLADFGKQWFKSEGLTQYGDDAFNETFPSYSTEVSGVTKSTRFCFYPMITVSSGALATGNAEGNVYLDNIKIQIVKE